MGGPASAIASLQQQALPCIHTLEECCTKLRQQGVMTLRTRFLSVLLHGNEPMVYELPHRVFLNPRPNLCSATCESSAACHSSQPCGLAARQRKRSNKGLWSNIWVIYIYIHMYIYICIIYVHTQGFMG